MDKTNSQEVKSCSKCAAKKNSKEQKKCTTCEKTKQKMLPIVVFSIIFFGFAVYGTIVFIKEMIGLFTN